MDYQNQEPIWGYAFELSESRTHAYINLKPTKGILSPDRTAPFTCPDGTPFQPSHERLHRPAKYFVPYNKNGTIIWSKARNIYNTRFAKTETEATYEYNKLVADAIESLYKTAAQLGEEFVKPVDDTIAVPPAVLAHIPDLRKDCSND